MPQREECLLRRSEEEVSSDPSSHDRSQLWSQTPMIPVLWVSGACWPPPYLQLRYRIRRVI